MNANRNARSLLLLVALLSLLALFAVARPLSGVAAPDAQRTVTRTATRTPTRRPTATRTPLTTKLKTQLYFGGLGGHGDEMFCTEAMLNQVGGRGILALGRIDDDPMTRFPKPFEYVPLCVFGVPFDQGITIELYRPDGGWGGVAEYYLAGENYEIGGWDLRPVDPDRNERKAMAVFINDAPVIQFLMWVPDGLPQGEWYASLRSGEHSLADTFSLPPWQPAPMVSVDRPPLFRFPNAFLLGRVDSDYMRGGAYKDTLTTGDKVMLYGAGFSPGSVTYIGAYQTAPDTYSYLVNQLQARANRRGEWSAIYTLGKNDSPGGYELVTVLDPTTDSGNFAGPSVYYTIEEWRPCPNTYSSRLKAGTQAQVLEGQKSNRLRSGPTRSVDNVIGLIPAGQTFDILDGPRCADGWVWWYVRTRDGQKGWTSEGDGNQRWLEPAP